MKEKKEETEQRELMEQIRDVSLKGRCKPRNSFAKALMIYRFFLTGKQQTGGLFFG
jgi:hypothetical protein